MDSLSTPLHEAVKAENFQNVKTLILNGAEINATDGRNETPLFYAVKKNLVSIVEFLLQNCADIEAKYNFSNRTPLYVASSMGHLEIVKMLLKKGANVDAMDFLGFTPIHCACGHGHNLIVEELLQYGADIESLHGHWTKNTPLLTAAETTIRNAKTIETLVPKGAKLDAKNARGDTPIHLAISYGGKYQQVLTLMKLGVSMNIRNHDGLSPIECAFLKENQYVNNDAKLRTFKVISYNEME